MGEANNVLWKKKLRDLEESSTDESEKERRKVKKLKKLLKKEKRKTEKLLRKKLKYDKKLKEKSDKKKKVEKKESKKITVKSEKAVLGASEAGNSSADVPLGLMERSKAMAPMTKEEWDKRQSIVRRVLDEESGRYRLIKGDGEVLEEIVSYDRHKEINQNATRADGEFFQSQTVKKRK